MAGVTKWAFFSRQILFLCFLQTQKSAEMLMKKIKIWYFDSFVSLKSFILYITVME